MEIVGATLLDSRKLNAGCWQQRLDGYLNMDIYSRGPDDAPEVVADIRDMPFPDNYFEEVLMSHILEHLQHDDVVGALREVYRVLQPGGVAKIIGPDYDRAERSFLAGEIDTDYRPLIWGHGNKVRDATGLWETTYDGQSSEDHPGADHLWCSTEQETLALVSQVFVRWVCVDSGDDRWQFAIEARRL